MLPEHGLIFRQGRSLLLKFFRGWFFRQQPRIPALILKPSSCKKTPRHLARSFPHLILHSIQLQLQFQINSDFIHIFQNCIYRSLHFFACQCSCIKSKGQTNGYALHSCCIIDINNRNFS